MASAGSNEGTAIGHEWLRREFGVAAPSPAVESYIIQGARRTTVQESRTFEFYPPRYEVDGTVASHLWFALRYEPTDLAVCR